MYKVKSGEEDIDVMKWMSRVALEYIGQGGLGYSFNALEENGTDTYSDALRRLPFVPICFRILTHLRLMISSFMQAGCFQDQTIASSSTLCNRNW